MEKWIDSLTEPQQRALAHQSGIKGFMDLPIEKLVISLKESKEAKGIYDRAYAALRATNYEERNGDE